MIKKVLLILFTFMFIPFNIKAFQGSINVTCNKTTLTINETTSCSLTGYSNDQVSSVSLKISANDSIKVSNIKTSSIWQGDGEGGSVDLYTDNNKTGTFQIAAFTLEAKKIGAGTVNISSVVFSDAGFTEFGISSKTLNITINAPTTTTTTTTVNNITTTNKVTTNTTTTIATTKIAEQTTTKKEDNTKSSDATLNSLVLNPGKLDFDPNVFNYSLNLGNDVEKITITATATDSKAKITLPKDLTLKEGINKFEIIVEAEDGTKKVYNIKINKLERPLSSNCNLKNLKIENYKIEFETNKKSYFLNNIKESKLNIKAIAEDDKAKIKIYGNKNLTKEDVIVIKVEAEDGTINEYILYANSNYKMKNIPFIISIIGLSISIIINLVMFIGFKKNKQKKEI